VLLIEGVEIKKLGIALKKLEKSPQQLL